MSKFISIKISDFTGIFNTIAEKANINGGRTLEGEEINLFYEAKNNIKKTDNNKSIFSIGNRTYDSDGNEIFTPPLMPFETGLKYKNIYKNKESESFFERKNAEIEKEKALIRNENALKTAEQYVKVKDVVLSQMRNHSIDLDNIRDKKDKQEFLNKAEYVTKIVCEQCEKYGISDLSAVITQIMGIESGGYKFDDAVMKNSGSQYKGVMQTDFEVCCCIFGKSSTTPVDIGKKKSLKSKHKTDELYKASYEAFFSQDAANIKKLREKYKTPEALYEAIQQDVELSLEVGILCFKSKLSVAKGDVAKAVKMYCGNHYTVNLKDVPSQFDVKR